MALLRHPPPGASAPRRPSREQRRAVQAVMRRHVEDVLRLEQHSMAALLPVFQRAEAELVAQLRHWIAAAPDGELRWTAQSYRVALMQLQSSIRRLSHALARGLEQSETAAQRLALRHLVDEVARFSEVFEGVPRRLAIDEARAIATGQSYIIPRIRTSAARYAGDVGDDIRQRLAVDILKGAPLHQTVDRLVEHGGPRGVVALRGVAGEENALVEFIPEGLFRRYRYWAERIVRTETASAYNAVALDGIRQGMRQVPGLVKRWCADGGGCVRICQPLDGVTVGVNEDFETNIGPRAAAPAHPMCRCRCGAWKSDWPALFDSIGVSLN